MASYQPVKYIEGGTDTPASQATAKLIAALRATKKLVFEVIRLPDTDVPVVDGDMKDLDMLRRCIVHSDRYYKSKQALRLSTNLSKAQKMHRDTLHQIERAIEEEKAAFKHDQKNLFIGEDDDAESKTVALADAPLRPCKTASAKQTLTEADFPLTGRYLADDISVKVGYQEINVRQWLTDSRAQKFGPGMGKLKLYEKVSLAIWPGCGKAQALWKGVHSTALSQGSNLRTHWYVPGYKPQATSIAPSVLLTHWTYS